MSIIVHHLNNSRSQRILWLLEELGVPYTIEKYQRGPDQRAPDSLKAVHPLGKSPVITDGSVTLAESGAIVDYIIRKYGLWTHFAEGESLPLDRKSHMLTLFFNDVKDH
jgi:glutathione S-transferase